VAIDTIPVRAILLWRRGHRNMKRRLSLATNEMIDARTAKRLCRNANLWNLPFLQESRGRVENVATLEKRPQKQSAAISDRGAKFLPCGRELRHKHAGAAEQSVGAVEARARAGAVLH
jgi:hypothetical protein